MTNPLVSILLPAYNAEKYIAETIDSLLSQSYQNFELLIADDGSIDTTKQIIDQYEDTRIMPLHNSENIGKPRTIERLFNHSSGQVITMHDADDVSHPERLKKMIIFMNQNPDLMMAGHIIQRMSEDGRLLPLYRKKSNDRVEIINSMEVHNTDGDPSMFIRRQIIESIGGLFRPYFQNNMDYDLALRIIEKYATGNLLEVLSYYRNVPGSISKGIDSYKKLTTQKITQYLHKERLNGQQDALQRDDWPLIEQLEKKYAEPYMNDPTLHLREMASFFMYTQMYKEAIKYSWRAIMLKPFSIINLRTFQYCVRKTFLKL